MKKKHMLYGGAIISLVIAITIIINVDFGNHTYFDKFGIDTYRILVKTEEEFVEEIGLQHNGILVNKNIEEIYYDDFKLVFVNSNGEYRFSRVVAENDSIRIGRNNTGVGSSVTDVTFAYRNCTKLKGLDGASELGYIDDDCNVVFKYEDGYITSVEVSVTDHIY